MLVKNNNVHKASYKISEICLSRTPLLTLKYACLWGSDRLGEFPRRLSKFHLFCVCAVGLLAAGLLCGDNLQWILSGIESSIGLETGKNAFTVYLKEFVVQSAKSRLVLVEKQQITIFSIALNLARNIVFWSVGNVIGSVPKYLLARYFFVHLAMSRKFLLFASFVPFVGCFPILAGAGGASLQDFLAIALAEALVKNVFVQNYLTIASVLPVDGKVHQLQFLAAKLHFLVFRSASVGFLRIFLSVKSILLFAIYLKCSLVMIEHCAKAALANRK